MDDLISRQAAIDAIKGLPTWWADEGGYYGGAQKWQSTFGLWYASAYHRIATGMKEDTDVNVKS